MSCCFLSGLNAFEVGLTGLCCACVVSSTAESNSGGHRGVIPVGGVTESKAFDTTNVRNYNKPLALCAEAGK